MFGANQGPKIGQKYDFLKETSKFGLFGHFDPKNVELKFSNLFTG